MIRYLLVLSLLALVSSLSAQTQRYPYVLGYSAGQQIMPSSSVTDTIITSFSGGAPNATQWVQSANQDFFVLSGFRHDILYVENAFEKELFASKGYFGDYVEIRWDLARYASQVTAFRIFRKEVGSNSDSTQVANLPAATRTWQDQYAESGTMYEYTLFAEGISDFKRSLLNLIQAVGFRVPYGRISGRVTYAGGTAVQGVSVIAESQDDFDGSSIYLNGTDASLGVSHASENLKFKFDNAFTFQMWYLPDNLSTGGTVFQKGGQYKITYGKGSDTTLTDTIPRFVVSYPNPPGPPVIDTLSSYTLSPDTTLISTFFIYPTRTAPTGVLTFYAGTESVHLKFIQKTDTFFNITAMRTTGNSLKLYAIYTQSEYNVNEKTLSGSTPANDSLIRIGRSSTGDYLKGYIDEIRIWRRAFTEEELIPLTLRYIEGTENNLTAYYRLNEAIGDHFYDLSRKGFAFNEHHGEKGNTALWDTTGKVPFKNQLAVKGITDQAGNYIIAGIPYSTNGSVYNFVPVFGVHNFNPKDQILFIGPGAGTHNNINFTDIASFRVSGEVYYSNTYFPVEGVTFLVDGQVALNANGVPIRTDGIGAFVLDIPIGEHSITAEKNGHVIQFDGESRFPSDTTLFDFQQPYTFQQRFLDTTLIKVIGKVVGGPREAAKPKGLGKTINNLGPGTIVLTTQKGYDLTNKAAGVITTTKNRYYEGATPKDKGVTRTTIVSTSPKQMEIKPDPITGEYVAWLLPEKYTVTSVKAGTYTYGSAFHTTLDLTNTLIDEVEIDSVLIGTVLTPLGDTINTYRLDSIAYKKNHDLIYRSIPVISVTNTTDSIDFWENEIQLEDTLLTVVDHKGRPLTQWPIFMQRGNYELKISVFESYVNGALTDNVPVTDGVVEIQNALAIDNAKKTYEIDDFGIVNYKFQGGLPNIVGDLTHSMSIIALTGKGGAIQTPWNYVTSSYTGPFKGYVFGGMPSGNNFVTAGPNRVNMVIRDPYGSESYAWFAEGNSVLSTSKFEVTNANIGSEKISTNFGAEITTFVGVGTGVIVRSVTQNTASLGIDHSETWVNNNTTTSKTTASLTWKTSSSPDFVGADGDIFIGNSVNIVYGISKNLTLIDSVKCLNCVAGTGVFEVGIENNLRVNPKFGTAFQFSQNHIKNNLIPNLKLVRDLYLQNSPFHTSVDALGSPDYGKPNDPSTVVNTVFYSPLDGDSIERTSGNHYSFEYLQTPFADTALHKYGFVDSVAYYNEQISSWEGILANNEREKLQATTIENLSFDAGVVYTSSKTYDSTEITTSSFAWNIAPVIAAEIGFSVAGTGLTAHINESYSHTRTRENGTEETSTVTFGYELADSDLGDYLSIDVKQPRSHTGPVFSVRGGQSKCPYIDVDKTTYFQPGTALSQATAQREVPQILSPAPVQINVPEDQPANFQVQLGNISQTKDDAWFRLTVDGTTNQNGARITMDGIEIGNGLVVLVPASGSVNKIISVEKVLPAVNDYVDIGIILSSDCESSIADTVFLTARFKPVCSQVNVSTPLDLWVRNTNTGDSLTVVIDDYNLAHTSFKEIAFQYKPTSSSAWITDQKWFVDLADYIADTTAKNGGLWINGNPSLTYIWDMSSIQDRTYDIRTTTTCADLTTHSSLPLTGIKDSKRPKIFGTPQPGDGILSPGDDVMLTFDEQIEAGLLLSSNFSVTGVLNGAPLRHSSSLYFDGIDDYASAIAGVNLNNKSFTIEFWTKRQSLARGAIFSQTQLEMGFNATNQFYVKLGQDSVATVHTYGFTNDWIHFTVAFDGTTNNLNVYSAYQAHNQIEIQDRNFPASFVADGRMYVGNNSAKTKPYNGLLHDLRVWEKVIGYGTANADMLLSLTGDEIGLSGFWPMDELKGAFATDLSRSHHAILHDASWRVEPSGYARRFPGNATLSIPTASSFIITDEMDFTIEFWFRGGAQTNTVMFSNGKADGTEPPQAFKDIWNIGFNASGNLYAKNNAVSITDANSNYLDNQWHHFALVLRRKGNTSIFVDGNLKGFSNSTNFGGLFANSMAIGSNRHYTNGTPYANHFSGSIDEFRAWRLARTEELVNMDMHNKITGDEKGLAAYYPFDKYDINLILQPTLKDNDVNEVTDSLSLLSATAIGGLFDNTNVPLITDARPVQNLAFNWVVNNDKIIINLLEPAALLEKQVVTFTVDRVEDLRENRMASPETWTAFIRKNTVLWYQQALSFVKKQYDTLSFLVGIQNNGGLPQNYTISNLPSWLTVSSASGSLAPTAGKKIRFTVDPSVNIGTYEEVIYLTSDFGFSESLLITLKVQGDEPNWNLNPANYQYSMNVIGSIRVDGLISNDPDDKLVAVVNDTVRGVAALQYISAYDSYLVFMDVYSNVVGGETVDFWVWDASKGKTHTEVTPSLNFQSNGIHGVPSNPILFDAINTYYEPIAVAKGWNWLSFPLNSTSQNNIDQFLSSIGAQSGDILKGDTMYDQYSQGLGWTGTITSTGGIRPTELYKLNTSSTDTLDYVGSKIDPALHPLPIDTGWNWIGFISQNNMTVANSFTNYHPAHGDLIKGQLSFAIYDSILGWVGNLTFLKPKRGYMYQSSKVDTLIYPDSDLFSFKSGFEQNQEYLNSIMALNEHDYRYNMSTIATADLCEQAPHGSYLLVAYKDNEVRGVSKSQKENFYITTYGNGAVEELTFKIMDEFGNSYSIAEKLSFVPNALKGSISYPIELHSLDTALYLCEEYAIDNPLVELNDEVSIYPTIFNEYIQFDYILSEDGVVQIELMDVAGHHVRTILNEHQSKGANSFRWESYSAKYALAAGVYFVKVTMAGKDPVVQKVIRINQ